MKFAFSLKSMARLVFSLIYSNLPPLSFIQLLCYLIIFYYLFLGHVSMILLMWSSWNWVVNNQFYDSNCSIHKWPFWCLTLFWLVCDLGGWVAFVVGMPCFILGFFSLYGWCPIHLYSALRDANAVWRNLIFLLPITSRHSPYTDVVCSN